MEVAVTLVLSVFTTFWSLLSTLLQFLGKKKAMSREKQEILKWVSESAGKDISSLQELWQVGPSTLGRYIEQLNGKCVTWWTLQDFARSTFAVPQVMTRHDMARLVLEEKTEKKFLRLLTRLKEALDRIEGTEGSHRFRVSSDIVAKGVALSSAYTKMRGVFFVYSYSNDLENIQIEMNGPSIVQIETKMRKDGLMVGYTVTQSGIYSLEISKNNWSAPGSPFQVNIQNPPVGYKGNFGSSMWDKSEKDEFINVVSPVIDRISPPSSMMWEYDQEEPQIVHISKEKSPNRPNRKKKNYAAKQQVVELSQIAAAIILARRFTNRMQSRIPDLRVERNNDDQTELNLWSAITSPPPSMREITYVSPEGATFPISVTGRSQRDREGGNGRKLRIGPSGHETYEDWFYGPPPTAPRDRGTFQSLISPDGIDAPKTRKEPTFPPLNMVRPFNHEVTEVTSSESETTKIVHGRIWSQRRSIGVNTDVACCEIATNQAFYVHKLSKCIQVGESFIYCIQTEEPFIEGDKSGPSPNEPRKPNKRLLVREHSSHDSFLSRTKKSDTFNSDDTSSSGMTNYSEKVIEMDLKVNYETIALTSTDDEISLSESQERARERTCSITSTINNCTASSTSASINKASGRKKGFDLEHSLGSGNFNSDNAPDGIYKATLMSIDLLSPGDGESGSEDDDRNVLKSYNKPLVYPKCVQSQWVASGSMENTLHEHCHEIKSSHEPLSAISDGQVLTVIVDEVGSGKPCESTNLYYSSDFHPNGVWPAIEEEVDEKTKKNLGFQHFKYLSRRKWARKPSTRCIMKQKGATCKRHLRMTLSFIQAFDKCKKYRGPSKGNAVYSFGPYPVKKDIIPIPTPVKAWKDFWDNMANRTETRLPKDLLFHNRGVFKTNQPLSSSRSRKEISPVQEENLKDEDRKRRFETAKQHFTKLEKDKVITSMTGWKNCVKNDNTYYDPKSIDHRWDLKDLFKDFNEGLGKPGVANRLGVLATLQSMEPVFTVGGFESQYPHLPVVSRNDTSSVLELPLCPSANEPFIPL